MGESQLDDPGQDGLIHDYIEVLGWSRWTLRPSEMQSAFWLIERCGGLILNCFLSTF